MPNPDGYGCYGASLQVNYFDFSILKCLLYYLGILIMTISLLIRYILAMRNLALSTAVGEHGDLGPLVQLLVDAEGVMLKVNQMVMPKWVLLDLPPLPKL